MTGPISGNYTPTEIQELTQIWQNLPNADDATLKSDIQTLSDLAKTHPELSNIVNLLNTTDPDKGLADFGIAYHMYSSSPNVMSPEMTSQIGQLIQNFQANPYNPSPEQLTQYGNQLSGLLAGVQKIQPPSPQTQIIIKMLSMASDTVKVMQGGHSTPFGGLSPVADNLQFLLSNLPKS